MASSCVVDEDPVVGVAEQGCMQGSQMPTAVETTQVLCSCIWTSLRNRDSIYDVLQTVISLSCLAMLVRVSYAFRSHTPAELDLDTYTERLLTKISAIQRPSNIGERLGKFEKNLFELTSKRPESISIFSFSRICRNYRRQSWSR